MDAAPVPRLAAMELARTPRWVYRVARLLALALIAAPFALAFVPWQQSVAGSGRAIAFNPTQRPVMITSQIEGLVKKWAVYEGKRVKAGQRLVEMIDADPDLERRLLLDEQAVVDRLRAAENRLDEIDGRIRNVELAQKSGRQVFGGLIDQEKSRLGEVNESRVAAEANLDRDKRQFDRTAELAKQGNASQRDLEVAKNAFEGSAASLKAVSERVKIQTQAVKNAEDRLKQVDADYEAALNSERAARNGVLGDIAAVRRDKVGVETRIARQRAQYVDSPCDGVVQRIFANSEEGGQLVRVGERLCLVVPDVRAASAVGLAPESLAGLAILAGGGSLGDPAALIAGLTGGFPLTGEELPGIACELLVDGNDLPLVRVGDKVRLQFEGWPAVQFVGWPSTAVGTFGGLVRLVDPTASDGVAGQFRILVEPDPADEPWPGQDYLRQGVRAQGWVLLERVSLGWEVWRQVNGFPPFRSPEKSKAPSRLGPVRMK